jgi:uncharacterized protein YkwD
MAIRGKQAGCVHMNWLRRGLIILALLLLIMATSPESSRGSSNAPMREGRVREVFASETNYAIFPVSIDHSIPSIFSQTVEDCPTDFERSVLLFVNHERSLMGLSILQVDIRLQSAARWMSDDMAAHDWLPGNHVDSLNRTPGERVAQEGGYPYEYLGEVIAGGYATPKDVFEAWMNSPGHQAILLGANYEHIGIGYTLASGTSYVHFWTADLGSTTDERQAPLTACDPGFYRIFHPIIMK